MEKLHVFSVIFSVVLWSSLFHGSLAVNAGCPQIGFKQFSGYVEVRPKAHMFWLLYKNCAHSSTKSLPTILCLAGGPGLSSVGFSNFGEVGPMDIYLNPRNQTWLKKAHLLFVDSPVGTGYSYVEDPTLLVKTDEAATDDLLKLLINVFERLKDLQKTELYIQGESYGGKLAVTLGLSALDAIKDGELKVNRLGGVIMGSAWISPGVQVLSWGPVLRDVSRLDNNGLHKAQRLAIKINEQIAAGKLVEAYDSYNDLKDRVIIDNSNGVVDKLLATGVSVSIYAPQLDVLSSPRGTEAWLVQLKWPGLKPFLRTERSTIYCDEDLNKRTGGFVKSYMNLNFYWILDAGHFVPMDQPCITLNMIANIIQSSHAP
ncbi:carboxypeptidase [Striga asiatica]|uniref:Carboxypeptidase n=1 Tax=Striga asiatica TaxID=4170 RepID=A0A5A7Q4E4_STRAF|nr:carboxypeptidase [Striga asiatica]